MTAVLEAGMTKQELLPAQSRGHTDNYCQHAPLHLHRWSLLPTCTSSLTQVVAITNMHLFTCTGGRYCQHAPLHLHRWSLLPTCTSSHTQVVALTNMHLLTYTGGRYCQYAPPHLHRWSLLPICTSSLTQWSLC